MKTCKVLAGIALSSALCLGAYAQSLGEQARELRADKPATPQTKVYTNDNLPTGGSISVVGSASAPAATNTSSPSSTSTDKPKATSGAAATSASAAEQKQKADDKLKADIESQKGEISRLERELDISNREWKLRQAAYYADAGNQLRDPAAWAAQERKYNDDIAQKKQALDDARQKLEDLQEQGRKAGMSSSQTE